MKATLQTQSKASSLAPATFAPVRRSLLQRKCACGGTPGLSGECESCRKKRETGALWRAADHPSSFSPHPSEAPPIVHEVLRSPGQPIDAETRAFMEPRFGHDFSQVRVHTDTVASHSADAIGAKAYTSGNEIAFGVGQYRPATHNGKTLIAHELVHVLQQRCASNPSRQTLTPYSHAAEVEAGSVSEAVIQGGSVSPIQTRVGLSPQAVSRQLDPRKVYCAMHAALCLSLSENPPVAALCWANFVQRCSGAMASAGQPSGDDEAVASGAPGGAISEGETGAGVA